MTTPRIEWDDVFTNKLNQIIKYMKTKRLWCFVAYEKSTRIDEFLPVHSVVFDDFNKMKTYSAEYSAHRGCTPDGKPEFYSTYFDTTLDSNILKNLSAKYLGIKI